MDEYKEAIDAIRANYPPENYTMLREGLDLAIITLKKQIPEKPIIHKTGTCQYCKKCGEFVSKRDNYCRICGQKLDWEV